MKIRCECGAIYNVPESTCGKNVQCKKCGTTFVCPTPPPKVSFNAGVKTETQNVPGTFASSPYARSKSKQAPPEDQDAILKKYMSEEKSLEDRLRERRENSIETDRTSNSISFIIVGCIWIIAGILIGISMFWMASFTRIPIFFAWIYGLGGQYWLPPLLCLYGIYKIVIGVMSLMRFVDIQSEEQLPTFWG